MQQIVIKRLLTDCRIKYNQVYTYSYSIDEHDYAIRTSGLSVSTEVILNAHFRAIFDCMPFLTVTHF